jgi:hypothetical protein
MSLFIVRVELHQFHHQHPNYASLHVLMSNAGFAKRIRYENKVYELPPAEYAENSDRTTKVILSAVKIIANSIDVDNGVMVTKSYEFLQDGLREIK